MSYSESRSLRENHATSLSSSTPQVQTWMNVSRLREETSILKNIKQREIIEMKKKENQVKLFSSARTLGVSQFQRDE